MSIIAILLAIIAIAAVEFALSDNTDPNDNSL